ncbi:MAG: glycosyltransferase family 2 protein [Anaerolineales bacterium]|nr:glycosyltransferase family 2 protein [Anaerolineales bacterium]
MLDGHIKWISESPIHANSAEDLVVVCVVRNGAGHVVNFINHHLQLGAKSIILLDNCSTDETINNARKFGEKVTILSSKLPFNQFEMAFRAWMVNKFAKSCWCLLADIDERFQYPYSPDIELISFLRYLNQNNYSGVNMQMVDLFADGSIDEWPNAENVERDCVWYDTSGIRKRDFEPISQLLAGNSQSSKEIKLLRGGIRAVSLGAQRSITKQALIFPSRGVTSLTPHWAIGAHFADVSCALLHYPFDRLFYERCAEIVQRKSHWKNSGEYRIYLNTLIQEGSKFSLKGKTAKQFTGDDQLVADGFLVVSKRYSQFVETTKATSGQKSLNK